MKELGNLWMLVLLVGLSAETAIAAEPVAQTPPQASPTTLKPDPTPVDLNALDPAFTPDSVITSRTISATQLTIPSLWWIWQQLANQAEFSPKLLQGWIAYPSQQNQPGRIDVVLNRQVWSLIDYMHRYEFIHHISATARGYGYNTRFFDEQAKPLAAYTCDFTGIDIAALQDTQFRLRRVSTSAAQGNDAVQTALNKLPCVLDLASRGKAGALGRPKSQF